MIKKVFQGICCVLAVILLVYSAAAAENSRNGWRLRGSNTTRIQFTFMPAPSETTEAERSMSVSINQKASRRCIL